MEFLSRKQEAIRFRVKVWYFIPTFFI